MESCSPLKNRWKLGSPVPKAFPSIFLGVAGEFPLKHWRGIAGHQSGLDGMAGRVDNIHMDSHGTFFLGGERLNGYRI